MKKSDLMSALATVSAWDEAQKQANGTVREWAVCYQYGIIRKRHDNVAYDKGSDLDVGDLHMSVKAEKFSLMAGSLCKGCETFDAIWERYERNVHSNSFVYVTRDGIAYMMNLAEFKQFVYATCGTERESKKNGGMLKIKMRSESKKVIAWLEAHMG